MRTPLKNLNKIIQTRIRDGKDKNNRAFKALAKSTIKRRGNKTLHPSTTPSKSNLTETGQMVDDVFIKPVKKGLIRLGVDSRSANKAAGHVQGRGNLPVRGFLGLTRGERKHLTTMVRNALVKHLR